MHARGVMFVTTDMGTGGAERLLADIVCGLSPQRYRPVLVCLKQLGGLGRRVSEEGVPTYAGLLRHGRSPAVLSRLVRLIQRHRPAVVCTVGTGGDRSFWGRLAAWLAGVPVIISCPHSMGLPDRFEWPNRLLTPMTDVFVAVARKQQRYFVEQVGLPASKFVVIYNGVDLARFRPGRPERGLRRRLGLPPAGPVAGLVSMLRPEKNVGLFLRAAAYVHERLGQARFLIVGDGPERAELLELRNRLGLVGVVHFAGLRSDVERLLRVLDVLVLSSDFEAFPLTALEAGASGRPVVATRVGAVDEIVVHGHTGLLVEPGRAGELGRAMLRLLTEPELSRRLGQAARQRVEDHFGLDTMIDAYQALFDRLLERKGHMGRRARVVAGRSVCRLANGPVRLPSSAELPVGYSPVRNSGACRRVGRQTDRAEGTALQLVGAEDGAEGIEWVEGC